MSVLSDIEIMNEIGKDNLVITGWPELYIGPSSLDMHLDNKCKTIDATKVSYFLTDEGTVDGIDISADNSDIFTEENDWEYIVLYPRQLYLLSTVERIKFPDDVVGFIQGRSSIARLGINVHNAGYFDAGFEGTATLEVTNLTQYPIKVPKHTRICQMVFVRTGMAAQVPYGKKKDSKYQGQNGPTLTGAHQDFK